MRQASASKSHLPEGYGSIAPLDAQGFYDVTSMYCPMEMEQFFNRMLKARGYNVCSKPHVQGLMHWFLDKGLQGLPGVPTMDFAYCVELIDNGNPCKYWSPKDEVCPIIPGGSEKCAGHWCDKPISAAEASAPATQAPATAATTAAAPTTAAPTTAPAAAAPGKEAPEGPATTAAPTATPATLAPVTAALTTVPPITAASTTRTTTALATASSTTAASTTTTTPPVCGNTEVVVMRTVEDDSPYDARFACPAGYFLAMPKNAEYNQCVLNGIKKLSEQGFPWSGQYVLIAGKATGDKLNWDDGTPINSSSYQNWQEGEPNLGETNGAGKPREYMSMNKDTGEWAVSHKALYYACVNGETQTIKSPEKWPIPFTTQVPTTTAGPTTTTTPLGVCGQVHMQHIFSSKPYEARSTCPEGYFLAMPKDAEYNKCVFDGIKKLVAEGYGWYYMGDTGNHCVLIAAKATGTSVLFDDGTPISPDMYKNFMENEPKFGTVNWNNDLNEYMCMDGDTGEWSISDTGGSVEMVCVTGETASIQHPDKWAIPFTTQAPIKAPTTTATEAPTTLAPTQYPPEYPTQYPPQYP